MKLFIYSWMRYFAKIAFSAAFDGFVLGQKNGISIRRAAGWPWRLESVISSVLCTGKVRWIDDRLVSKVQQKQPHRPTVRPINGWARCVSAIYKSNDQHLLRQNGMWHSIIRQLVGQLCGCWHSFAESRRRCKDGIFQKLISILTSIALWFYPSRLA